MEIEKWEEMRVKRDTGERGLLLGKVSWITR